MTTHRPGVLLSSHPVARIAFNKKLSDEQAVSQVQEWLDGGGSPLDFDMAKNQALHFAAAANRWALIEPLMAAGADLEAPNHWGDTPLMEACNAPFGAEGADAAMELLERGASATKGNFNGARPLHFAASAGMSEVCEEMMRRGADPGKRTEQGASAWMLAAQSCAKRGELGEEQRAKMLATFGALMERGPGPGDKDSFGLTALHRAAEFGAGADLIIFLIESGEDVNARDGRGRTPLAIACSSSVKAGAEERACLLLARGADPSIADKSGAAPIGLSPNSYPNAAAREAVRSWSEAKALSQAASQGSRAPKP